MPKPVGASKLFSCVKDRLMMENENRNKYRVVLKKHQKTIIIKEVILAKVSKVNGLGLDGGQKVF